VVLIVITAVVLLEAVIYVLAVTDMYFLFTAISVLPASCTVAVSRGANISHRYTTTWALPLIRDCLIILVPAQQLLTEVICLLKSRRLTQLTEIPCAGGLIAIFMLSIALTKIEALCKVTQRIHLLACSATSTCNRRLVLTEQLAAEKLVCGGHFVLGEMRLLGRRVYSIFYMENISSFYYSHRPLCKK
jgi:hypothetical protein